MCFCAMSIRFALILINLHVSPKLGKGLKLRKGARLEHIDSLSLDHSS